MIRIGNRLRAPVSAAPLEGAVKARILQSLPDGVPAPGSSQPRWSRRQVSFGALAAAAAWFVCYPIAARLSSAVSGQYALSRSASSAVAMRHGFSEVGGLAASPQLAAPQTVQPPSGLVEMKARPTLDRSGVDDTRRHVPEMVATSGARHGAPRSVPLMLGGSASASAQADSATGAGRIAPLAAGGGFTGTLEAARHTGAVTDGVAAGDERQVHKEGDITVQVDRVEQRSEAVSEMVTSDGGFVATNQFMSGDDGKTASLVVKVPVGSFESIMNRIANLGEVTGKTVNGEDITERVSDQEAEARVLQGDTSNLQAMVSVRRRKGDLEALRQLRIRTAQSEARLRTLRRMAALATIDVTLMEKPKPQPAPHAAGFLDDIGATAHDAAASFVQAAKLPILAMVWMLAYAPVLIVLGLVYRYFVRTA